LTPSSDIYIRVQIPMQASLSMYTCGECNNGCGEDSSTISFQCGHYWPEACISKLDVRQAYLCEAGHELKEFTADEDGYSCSMCHKKFPEGKTRLGCRQCDFDACNNCLKFVEVAPYDGTSFFFDHMEKCPKCTWICSDWVKNTLAGKPSQDCCRVTKNGGWCPHPHIDLRYSSQQARLNPKRQRASKRLRDKRRAEAEAEAEAEPPASAEAAVQTEFGSSWEASTQASSGTQSPEESRFDFENAEACLHSLKNPMRMQNDSDADSPERRAANVTQSILLERHLTVLFEQSAGFTPQAQAFIRMSMSFDPEWPPFMGLVEASCVTNQTDAEALAEVLQKVQPSRLILYQISHLTGQPPLLGHVAFQLCQDLFALKNCEFHGLQVQDLPSVEAFLNRCQAPRCTLCGSNFQAEDVLDLRQRASAQVVIEVVEAELGAVLGYRAWEKLQRRPVNTQKQYDEMIARNKERALSL